MYFLITYYYINKKNKIFKYYILILLKLYNND